MAKTEQQPPSYGLGFGFAVVIAMLVVAALYGPIFGENGFWQESGMPWLSDTRSGAISFLYLNDTIGDPLRLFLSVPFHIGWLVSEGLGLPGSYLGYEVVFVLFWVARGVLTYGLVLAISPREVTLALLCSFAAMVQASDPLMLKISFLHQMAVPVWMLAGILCLALAQRRAFAPARLGLGLLGAIFGALAVFCYEAALPFAILAPALLLVLLRSDWKRALQSLTLWYLMIIVFLHQAVLRYVIEAGEGYGSYQASKLASLDPASLLGRFGEQFLQTLSFWAWNGAYPVRWNAWPLLIGAAACGVLAFGVFVYCKSSRQFSVTSGLKVAFFGAAGMGCGLMVTSLVPQEGFYRTLMIAYPWAGMLMGGVIYAGIAKLRLRPANSSAVTLILALALVVASAVATEPRRNIASRQWNLQQHAMSQITTLVPDVRDGTVILLLMPSKFEDIRFNPFADLNIWFDFPIRSAYRDRAVAGVLGYQSDGVRLADWTIGADGLTYSGNNAKPMLQEASPKQWIVLEMLEDRTITVLSEIPDSIRSDRQDWTNYRPSDRIQGERQSHHNRNRFGAFESEDLP